jgi:hypothetical protein
MELMSQLPAPKGTSQGPERTGLKSTSLKKRSLLGLASVAFALGLAACSSSPSNSSNSTTTSTSVTTTTSSPNTGGGGGSTSTTQCTIPQNNGGDHDADNNGGPNDGDGCM